LHPEKLAIFGKTEYFNPGALELCFFWVVVSCGNSADKSLCILSIVLVV